MVTRSAGSFDVICNSNDTSLVRTSQKKPVEPPHWGLNGGLRGSRGARKHLRTLDGVPTHRLAVAARAQRRDEVDAGVLALERALVGENDAEVGTTALE